MSLRFSRFLPAFPGFHFMAFAPLDAWARLLIADNAWRKTPARYWPRLAIGLATSTLGTAITLPERVLLGPLLSLAWRRRPTTPAPSASRSTPAASAAPIVFVLGYYRSGTTHLHYMLSCDPQFITPRWYQMLAPQGFGISWTLLRFFLVPFLSSTRPQDDVAFGPEYPAEDDFGLCNWSALGTMPGRLVLPGCWEHYKRFQTLENLSGHERESFEQTQFALTTKLRWLARGRGVLLKSPAHTARLHELISLYGSSARFIHLHREPVSVLRSNVAMHRRLGSFFLQDHPGDSEIRERIIDEYDRTERKFLDDARRLPDAGAGVLAHLRYEDLIADPVGEIGRVYAELGLELSPTFAERLLGYLHSVENYRAASQKGAGEGASDGRERVAPASELEWMNEAFHHDRPAIAKHDAAARVRAIVPEANPVPALATNASVLRPAMHAAAIGLMLTIVWVALAATTLNRYDWAIWPLGVIVGITALKAAGRGNARLGWIVGAIVLIAFLLRAWPATYLSEPRYHHPSPDRWLHVWRSTRDGVLTGKNLFWLALGVMSAARFASREHVRPPGL